MRALPIALLALALGACAPIPPPRIVGDADAVSTSKAAADAKELQISANGGWEGSIVIDKVKVSSIKSSGVETVKEADLSRHLANPITDKDKSDAAKQPNDGKNKAEGKQFIAVAAGNALIAFTLE